MPPPTPGRHVRVLDAARRVPPVGWALALLPGAAFLTGVLGGLSGLVLLALLALAGPVAAWRYCRCARAERPATAAATPAVSPRAAAVAALDSKLAAAAATGRTTACLMLHASDGALLGDRIGPAAADAVAGALADRARSCLREGDGLVRLDAANLVVALAPAARLDLETMLGMAGRLQVALSAPLTCDGARVQVRFTIGFAVANRLDTPSGEGLLSAAETAMLDARNVGDGAIRAHSPDMQRRQARRRALVEDVADALETGQIVAWYQPQLCTDTGRVSGLEALARWRKPDGNTVAPADFLPAIEAAGLLERLGEVMRAQALETLVGLDRQGLGVASVSVNVAAEEWRAPSLPDRVAWELDRHELTPDRLTLEILENLIAGAPDDVAARNIRALADFGCGIDLDDFGTGHASITSLRRFAIARVKIDRSFVSGVDSDPEQCRMVTAILTMCDRLGLGVVAEGVETQGEHARLAELGCGHVQGFGIARPMPPADLAPWLRRHAAQRTLHPPLRRRLG